MGGEQPAQGPSDEELIRAVEQRCIEVGVPAVPSREVNEVDYVGIQQQAIARRLEKLAEENRVGAIPVGRGWVWYIPESENEGGKVDFDHLNWSNIPAAEIPPEKVYNHPEYEDPTYWEKVDDDASVISRAGFWGMILGFSLFAVASLDPPYISLTQVQQDMAILAMVVGFALLIIAIVISLAATAGANLSKKGVDDWIREHYANIRSRVATGVPISVSVEWKNKSE